jgi:two-component system, NarL family, invasion response regulator UvrY
VLLDLSMPGKSGRSVLREMRRNQDRTPVLVVSMHPEKKYGERLRLEGAAGYLNKAGAGAGLVRAVEDVLAGRAYRADEGPEGKAHE